VLVRKPRVVRPDLPDDPMTLHAVRTFRLVVAHTTERDPWVRQGNVQINLHIPLVITVIAHEMDAWKIELAAAYRTLSCVEHFGPLSI